MAAPRPNASALPVANTFIGDLPNDPTPRDQAIYIPSVTPDYAIDALGGNWVRPLPHGLGSGDLNFLDPDNPLFRISHAMTSAGQALRQTKPCIIKARDRTKTRIIGDSGGYQIASGTLKINGQQDQLAILQFLEQTADLAMTLDVPTGPTLQPNSGYPYATSQDCLDATLEYLKFFAANRTPGKIHFLNVLQGNTSREADAWYDAVKVFPFEAWAFAGKLRHNFYYLCRRIIIMANEGQIQDKSWIHVLGTSQLDTAVLLTALQRAVNKYINPELRISFDTSTPFRMLSSNSIFTSPVINRSTMTLQSLRAPADCRFFGSNLRWPWPSEVGDLMTMGDFCVPVPPTNTRYHDAQSDRYHAHHNLSVLCRAIALANRVFDVEMHNPTHTLHLPVKAAIQAIDRVIDARDLKLLERYRSTFRVLRYGKTDDPGEDERDF